MKEETRKQLTLFINDQFKNIEQVRARFNPEQFELIPAHVTLCREDEIADLEKILDRISSIHLPNPIQVEFNAVKRFANGAGVLIPASGNSQEFIELRKLVLGQTELKKEQIPHITLMHPRNSTCTDEIFEQICRQVFPSKITFDKISLIEQKNGEKWRVLQEFSITDTSE